jgi:hypothetical protein
MVVQLGKRAVAALGGLPRRAVLAGGAVIAVALLISMVVALNTGDSSRGDARKPDTAAAAEIPDNDDPEAPLEATETPDTDGYEGATPLPEPTAPEPYATGLPEPLIVAAKPGTPTSPAVDFPADGCDHDYGKPDQCIPWGLPEGLKDLKAKCAYLMPDG